MRINGFDTKMRKEIVQKETGWCIEFNYYFLIVYLHRNIKKFVIIEIQV